MREDVKEKINGYFKNACPAEKDPPKKIQTISFPKILLATCAALILTFQTVSITKSEPKVTIDQTIFHQVPRIEHLIQPATYDQTSTEFNFVGCAHFRTQSFAPKQQAI